ncbi:Glycoprotein 3-alpha-L-fucosyltransferase A [Orchesella cincta]|uniref:Fucosyltransferase n=1 Tax=Orchesella cincta TaxID=48709 RepID=A0A1D2M1D2_ORCCI|nr:Glycoprotein 3-alpha-L-fucosyltransferase A [Orchesella cincta]
MRDWHAHDPATFLKIPECDDEFEITSNKSAIDRADAVVFSYAVFDHMKNDYLSYTHSAIRNPNVAFILSIQESEHHNYPMMPKKFDGIFNFIWMFRREAHIHPEFQEMYDKYEKPDEKWNYGSDFSYEFLKAKTKLAAWVVTNCNIQPGGRNEFVEQLRKHGIAVDIYGRCGNHSCEGNYTENNCFPRLGKEYKFYMALENSLCLDYITEKPAHGWENGMLPIIWGVGKKELAAPPGSYIDALEFKTIEELAERIKYLDKNPREYFKYFEWRQLYNTTLSYHAAFHCYAWRKIKKLTMELRANVTANAESAIGIKNLEFWRAYFYNDKLKLNCKNCVEEGVNVTHPNMNLHRLYNNVSKCVEALN